MKPTPQTETLLIVLRNVGQLLRYISPLPLALLPVTLWYRETHLILPVLAMFATMLLAGSLLARLPTHREPRLREGMLIAAVGWLAVPAGSIVLFVWGERWSLVDAFFETVSAWTGTGMSLADVTQLSRTTLFWRSLMQWVGGLGVVVLTLAILARPGTGAYTLYVGEARDEKLKPSVVSTVRLLWRIYFVLTVLAVVLLLVVGLSPWHALNHGLAGVSTGGMAVTPGGVGDYTDPAHQWAFLPIMLAGAIPFVALYALARGRWRVLVRDEQVRVYPLVMIPGILIILASLLATGARLPVLDELRHVAFQVVSATTTTGFQTVDPRTWPHEGRIVLTGLMLLGGAAGATCGGIKLFRASLLVRGALWKLRRSGLPSFAVTSFSFGGERLDSREANEEFAEASFILFLWVLALFGGMVMLFAILPNAQPIDLVFEIASALSNIGLTAGVVAPTLPPLAKGAFILIMWAGRLEILPVLLLLRSLMPGPSNR